MLPKPANQIPGTSGFSGWTLGFFLLALLAAGLAGWGTYSLQTRLSRQNALDQLSTVAVLKADQVRTWLEFQRTAAMGVSQGTVMAGTIEQWVSTGRIAEADRIRSLKRIQAIARTGGYVDVSLVKFDGGPLLSSSGYEATPCLPEPRFLEEALRTKVPVFSSIHRDETLPGKPLSLDLVAPMTVEDPSGARVVALMLLRIDPVAHLFPLIQAWPTPTRTGEALLVERRGNEAVFLNELRHRKNTALALRFTLDREKVLAVQALMGQERMEGLDYRYQGVLGAARAIPGMPWVLVAKQDREEVLGSLWIQALVLSIMTMMLVGVAALALRGWIKKDRPVPQEVLLSFQALRQRVVFLVLGLSVAGCLGGWGLYRTLATTELRRIASTEASSARLATELTETRVQALAGDLDFLANHSGLTDALAAPTEQAISHILVDWISFARAKGHYDQIRWLDLDGMELARVNLNAGSPRAVPRNLLQSKAGRDYVTETLKLERGRIFLSRFDLNIEQGRIERPLKPMLRIGTPLFDRQGVKRGILVVNVLGASLLTELDKVQGESRNPPWLVDHEGYWLKGPVPDLEWGFMFNRPEASMARTHPSAWGRIRDLEQGQFENAEGLWTFETVRPSMLARQVEGAAPWLDAQRNPWAWKAVFFVPRDQYHAGLLPIGLRVLGMVAFLMVVLVLAAWRVLVAARRQEEAGYSLQESRLMLQTVLDTIPAGVFWKDLEGRYLGGNRTFLKDAGFDSDTMVAGKSDADIWPDLAEAYLADDRKVATSGTPMLGFEEPLVGPDGRTVWVRTNKVPLRGTDQSVRGVLGTYEDITAQKRAEAEVRENQARLRAIFESAGVGISLTDRGGRYVEVNTRFAEFLGYQPEELLQLTYREITHPQDRELTDQSIQALMGGEAGSFVQEKRYLRKDGRVVWGMLSVSAIRDAQGATQNLIGIVADITERKRMETELASASERLTIATQGAGIGIWDWDVQKNEVVWDEVMYRIYGLDPTEERNASEAWLRSLDPTDPVCRREMDAALAGERDFAPEFKIRHPDGSIHHIKAASKTLRDADGKPVRMVGINFDITERVRAEEAVQESRRFAYSALNALSANLAVLDENGIILDVNQSWRAFAEANGQSAFTVSEGTNYLAICDAATGPGSEEAAAMAAGIRSVLKGEAGTFASSYPCHSPAEKRWFSVRVTRFPDGDSVRVVVAHSDITALKLAEDSLNLSLAQLSANLDNTPNVAVQWYDEAGRVLYWNPASETLYGWSAREALGKTLDELIYSPEEAVQFLEILRDISATGQPFGPYESPYRSRDGRRGWLMCTTFGIPMGSGQTGYVCMDVDITDRKAAEDALNHSMVRLRTILANLHGGVVVMNTEGAVESINGFWLRLMDCGMNPEDLVGQSFEEFVDHLSTHLKDPAAEIRRIREITAAGLPCHDEEFILGNGRTALRDFIPVELDGVVTGWVWTLRDITAIKEAERKQQAEEARLRALMLLHEGGAGSEKELIGIGIEEMAKLTGSRIAYLHFVNPDQETLELVAWNQEALKDCTAVKEDHYPISKAGVWADCFRLRKPVIHNDYQGLPDRHGYPEGHSHLLNHLSVPIFDGKEVVAIAGVGNKPTDFLEEDARQLTLFVGGLWNLLRRKRAEQKLHEHQETLTHMLNEMPVGVSMVDGNGAFSFRNQRFLSLFGYDETMVPTLAEWWLNAYPDPAYRALVIASWNDAVERAAREDTDVQAMEYRVTCRSGEIRDVEISGITIGDTFLATFVDQTERKLYEAMLSESLNRIERSEKDLKNAQRIAKVGSWTLEVGSETLTWSEETYRIFGMEPGTPVSMEVFAACIHPEERDQVFAAWSAAVAGAEYSIEHRIAAGDQLKWVHERADLEVDAEGKLVSGVGTVQDITELKQAEAALRASQQQLGALVDSARSVIFIKDTEGRHLLVNPFYEEATGILRQEVLGRTDLEFMPREVAEAIAIQDRKVMESKESVTFEEMVPRRDGSVRHYLTTKVPLIDETGRVSGLCGIATDITERKQQEAQIQQAKAAAESANRAKSEFLANMSHEIRTPMNAIMGLSHLALRTDLNVKQQDYLTRIQDSSRLLLGILNDILDFSKIEAGKLEIERSPFDLRQVFDHVSGLVSERAREKGLVCSFALSREIPAGLLGDSLRLSQVLLNLASNAVKFTERGSILVGAEVQSRDEERMVLRFEVRDSGIGIAPELMPRLFQSFSQADSTTTRRYGGSGLGLAISRRLVQLMGGEIGVESQPGQGSTFAFSVPLGIQAPSAAPAPQTVLSSALLGRRALVVDNDPDAQESIIEMLQSLGLVGAAVGSGTEAIEELLDEGPEAGIGFDLVLLDWRMPEMDGFETARRIHAEPRIQPKPSLLLVTAYGREEVDRMAEEAGFAGILLKPLSLSVLRDVLLEVLERQAPAPAREPGQLAAPTAARAPRGRILLAEDNETNLLVAREILQEAGFRIEVARNGQEAVTAALAPGAAFDLILMDVQMPGMDGLEATARIREFRKELPILAMTAHALESERQRCLQAGMNDHIAKPFEPAVLVAVLERWLPAGQDAGTFAAEASRSAPDADPANLLGWYKGSPEKLKQLLETMESNLSAHLSAIQEARRQADPGKAVRPAHSLKGMIGVANVPEIHRAASALDEALRSGSSWLGLAADLERALEPVLRGLRKAAASGAPRLLERPDLDLEQLRPLIGDLYLKLRRRSLAARKVVEELRARIGDDPHMLRLEGCMKRLDFNEAGAVLAELASELDIPLHPS